MQPLKVILHHDLAADNAVGHCSKSLLPVPDPDGRREAATAMLARAVHQSLDLALGEVAPALLTPFLHSLGRNAAWNASRSMQGRTRLRAVRHEAAARASRCACALPPGVGGTFRIQIFIQPSSPEICSEIIPGGEEGCRRGNGVACFWATSLDKIIGAVTAIVSYRPSR